MSWRQLANVVGCVALVSTATAADKRIEKKDVPAPVLAAVAAKYPNGALKQFEQEPADDGKGVQFEVRVDDGGKIADVIVSPDGKILVEELSITQSDLPAAVAKALTASKYGKSKVTTVERLTESGKAEPRYEIVVDAGGKKHELLFDAAGKLLEDEKKDADDETDAAPTDRK